MSRGELPIDEQRRRARRGGDPSGGGRVKKELPERKRIVSYNNPKGNAETERLLRTLKEELIWLREWRSPDGLVLSLGALCRLSQPGLPALGPGLPATRTVRTTPPHSIFLDCW